MQYDLISDFQRQAFLSRVDNLLERGAVVDLSEKTFRSRNQNSYLHLLIGVVAMETGNTLSYCKEWYFKRLCNKDLFITTREDKFAGQVEASGHPLTSPRRRCQWQLTDSKGGVRKMEFTCRLPVMNPSSGR